MTNKIQTKKAVLILVGLVIVSVLGTAAYYSSTGRLNLNLSPTGFLTEGSGTVALEIGQLLDITMIGSKAINLSLHPTDTDGAATGYVSPIAGGTTTINSEGVNDGGWLNVSDGAARSIAPASILINNTGSVNVSISVATDTNVDAQTFFGAGVLEAFFMKANDNQGAGSACDTESAGYIAYGEKFADGANASDTIICSQMLSADGTDQLNFTIQWIIPAGAAAGDGISDYNSTLTFTAIKATG